MSASLDCPSTLSNSRFLYLDGANYLLLFYDISKTWSLYGDNSRPILCARLESKKLSSTNSNNNNGGEGYWMGLGISSPNGTMRDGEAIIGYVPTATTAGSTAGTDTATNANDDDNKGSVIFKYNLQGPNNRGVSPMNEFQQTLLHTSIIHQQGNDDDGTMVMEFANYLKEEGDDDEHEIYTDRENTFLYAVGESNELGYHARKGMFVLDFS